MKRSELFLRTDALVIAATDLVKVRLRTLIPQAVAQEFSRVQPNVLDENGVSEIRLESPVSQVLAESIFSAARERAGLLVAQVIAEKLAIDGAAKTWRAGRSERERRVQRDFDEWARWQRQRTDNYVRLARLRAGSTAEPRPIALQRAKLRARIAALTLPRIN